MNKTIILSISALMLISSTAVAGKFIHEPVKITKNGDASGYASGNMVAARFANSSEVYIGCGIKNYRLGEDNYLKYGFCQAQGSNGEKGFCTTQDPKLLQSLRLLSSYSYINFGWNVDGNCTSIDISTQSFYIPEHLDDGTTFPLYLNVLPGGKQTRPMP